MKSFIDQFVDIPDPRIDRTKKHKLINILFITMAAVKCGCDEQEQIGPCGEKKEKGAVQIFGTAQWHPISRHD